MTKVSIFLQSAEQKSYPIYAGYASYIGFNKIPFTVVLRLGPV